MKRLSYILNHLTFIKQVFSCFNVNIADITIVYLQLKYFLYKLIRGIYVSLFIVLKCGLLP